MFCASCGKDLPESSSFCLHCGKPTAGKLQAAQKKSGGATLRMVGIGLLLLVLVAMLWSRLTTPRSSTPTFNPPKPAPILVPASIKLFTGKIVIRAGHYVTNTFTVGPEMQNYHVVGHFNASGGTGNDVQAVLADEDEFQNWINGHQARVLYSTEKVTNGKLDVGPLAPGRYVFALSNTFSAFSDKYVFAEVEARWMAHR